jgi:hypothetical protein
MQRTGSFRVTCPTGDTATQCGPRGTQDLKYNVAIESDEAHLDESGFIIDNNAVDAYFKSAYQLVKTFVSCELIALKAVRELRVLLGERALSIHVTISSSGYATDYASLTASWSRKE